MSSPASSGTGAADDYELRRLADQEVALRRLAELAARGGGRRDFFDAVVAEASRLLDASRVALMQIHRDGSGTLMGLSADIAGRSPGARIAPGECAVLERVLRTGGPARTASEDLATDVGAPIHVDGRLWGVLVASAPAASPADAFATRLAAFAEPLGPTIAAAVAHAELLDEHAALGRVAEVVARGGEPQELFDVVAAEASALIDGEDISLARVVRGAPTPRTRILAICGSPAIAPGTQYDIPSDDAGIVAAIVRERAPARVTRAGVTSPVKFGQCSCDGEGTLPAGSMRLGAKIVERRSLPSSAADR